MICCSTVSKNWDSHNSLKTQGKEILSSCLVDRKVYKKSPLKFQNEKFLGIILWTYIIEKVAVFVIVRYCMIFCDEGGVTFSFIYVLSM